MVHVAWLGKKSPFCGNVTYGNSTNEKLKARGHKVSFIHFDNPSSSNSSKPLFLANDPDVSLPYLIKSQVYTIPSPRAEKELRLSLERLKPDIVHASLTLSPLDFRLPELCNEINVPLIGTFHPPFDAKNRNLTASTQQLTYHLYAPSLAKFDRVIIFSEPQKNVLEKFGEPNPDAMVESAMYHAKILQDNDFHEFKISVKASDVFLSAAAYQALADATDAPLHLGITEAGGLMSGTIKSSIGLGSLLWLGIGDTIRVSLSADPVEEVKVGYDILKSLGLRHRGVNIISCPSCARQGFNVIETVKVLEDRLAHVKTPMSLSIIGCVVNGPGEALMTDVGFTGGGAGNGMVYWAGKQDHRINNDDMVDHIVELVEKRAKENDAEKIKEPAE